MMVTIVRSGGSRLEQAESDRAAGHGSAASEQAVAR